RAPFGAFGNGVDHALWRLLRGGAQADFDIHRKRRASLGRVVTHEWSDHVFLAGNIVNLAGGLREHHGARRPIRPGVKKLAGLHIEREELTALVRGRGSWGCSSVGDEPVRIERAARDAVLGHGAPGDDFALAGLWIAANDPIPLVLIGVAGHGGGTAVRREIE